MRVTLSVPFDITQADLESAAKSAQVEIISTNSVTGEVVVSSVSQSDTFFYVSLYYFGIHIGKNISK